jgi:hypothetical protein
MRYISSDQSSLFSGTASWKCPTCAACSAKPSHLRAADAALSARSARCSSRRLVSRSCPRFSRATTGQKLAGSASRQIPAGTCSAAVAPGQASPAASTKPACTKAPASATATITSRCPPSTEVSVAVNKSFTATAIAR